MTFPISRADALVARALVLGVLVLGAGACSDSSEHEQDQRTERRAPPPAPTRDFEPPPPAWTLDDIERADAVRFPEKFTPRSRDVAQAAADFASALATGDHASLASMLGERDRRVLNTMVNAGEWQRETESIRAVRINVLDEQTGAFRLGLGIQTGSGAYMTAWEAAGSGNSWEFSAIPIEPVSAPTLEELDNAPFDPPMGVAPAAS